jgi:hypothetical protein
VEECEGWSSTNITPSGFTVATYDVAVAGLQAMVAVVCKTSEATVDAHQVLLSPLSLSDVDNRLAALAHDNEGSFETSDSRFD